MKNLNNFLYIFLLIIGIGSVTTFVYKKDFGATTADSLQIPTLVLYNVLEKQAHIIKKNDLKFVSFQSQWDKKDVQIDWNLSETQHGTATKIVLKGNSNMFQYPKQKDLQTFLLQEKERILSEASQSMEVFSVENSGIQEIEIGTYLYLNTKTDSLNFEQEMDKALPEILMFSLQHGMPRNGSLFVAYHQRDSITNTVDFSTCIPVKKVVKTDESIKSAYMSKQKYYVTTLKGSYKNLKSAWRTAYKNVKKQGLSVKKGIPSIEVYKKGHTYSVNPADWITELCIPLEN